MSEKETLQAMVKRHGVHSVYCSTQITAAELIVELGKYTNQSRYNILELIRATAEMELYLTAVKNILGKGAVEMTKQAKLNKMRQKLEDYIIPAVKDPNDLTQEG